MKILIVDDEPDILDSIELCWMDEEDLEVRTAPHATKALEEIQANVPDVVLTDFRMPGMDGIELINRVKEAHPNVVTILMTAYPDPSLNDQARAAGCDLFQSKPFDPVAVLEQIRDVVDS